MLVNITSKKIENICRKKNRRKPKIQSNETLIEIQFCG